MPKISVIVPIYNTEYLLTRCLLSLHSQTEKDVEFILVDDASTDDSRNIMEMFHNCDSRFKTISLSQNEGVSIARNKGLDIATGIYIGFVDSDDYVSEDYFKVLSTAMEETHIPIAISKIITANRKIKEMIDYRKKETYIAEGNGSSCFHLFDRDLIGDERFIEHCRFEDSAFTIAMNMKSGRAAVADFTNYYYCIDNAFSFNMQDLYTLQSALDFIKVAEYLGELVEKNPEYSCYQEKIRTLQMEFDLDAASYIENSTANKEIIIGLLNHLQVLINKKYDDEYKKLDHPGCNILEKFRYDKWQQSYRKMDQTTCDKEFKTKIKSLIIKNS